MVTQPAFGRPQRQVMLHAVTGENLHRTVVAMDRQRDRHRTLRKFQPSPFTLRNLQIIRSHIELPAGHVETSDDHKSSRAGEYVKLTPAQLGVVYIQFAVRREFSTNLRHTLRTGINLTHEMESLVRKRRRSLAILLAWLVAVVPALAASLTATVDRNVVPVGESVRLNLAFEGVTPSGPPTLPAMPGLTPRGVSQSSAVTIIDGQTRQTFTYSYTLAATQPGDVTIPAIQAQAGGQLLSSQPLRVRVTPQSAAAAAAAVSNIAFIRLVVPKTEACVGEGIPVEMQLYYRNVEGVQMPQLKAEGFSVGQSAEPTQGQTQVGGVPYNLVVFRTSVTPARSGELTLGPVECDLTLLIPGQRRDAFDPFGMFSTHQRRRTKLQSEPVIMRVLPLPTESVPPSFTGAVGAFNMTVTAAPTNVAVGDPITVKVNISGRGRLDAFKLPEQSQWRDFNKYEATKKIDGADALGLAGTVAFEQVITPQNHEVRELAPLEFSFFDPEQKQYRTLTGPAIPLAVRNAAVAAAPPPVPTNAAANAEAPPADDILHIRPQFAAGSGAALLVRSPWFIGLQVVPVIAWLALFISRKRRESLANNPRLRRQREVAAKIRDGLKELHSLAAAQNSDQFFATLFRLLQEQIGERVDMPASAITEAVIDERLRHGNLPTATVDELHDLFQMCNQARYAPQKTSQELSAIIPRAETVLRELQRLRV